MPWRTTEPGGAAAGLERARALKRLKIKRDSGWHLAAYVILNGFLAFIWSLGGGWSWPVWMIVPWGIGLAFHAACTFPGGAVTERDIQREMGTRDRRARRRPGTIRTAAVRASEVEMNRRWAYAAAASAAVAFGYRWVLRPWHERWGATGEEVRAALPGDDLVADPARQSTRAITVHAPAGQVWPWVVQLGADRGGFYSYDWLENLFRLGIHSAGRVVPDWQRRAVGDLVYADAAGTGGWYVRQVVPGEVLVLQMANVAAGRPARRDEQLRWEFLWTFATKDQGDGTTRLLVRERVGFGSTATRLLMSPVGLVSFVMTRKMMRGIRARAEASARQATDADLAG